MLSSQTGLWLRGRFRSWQTLRPGLHLKHLTKPIQSTLEELSTLIILHFSPIYFSMSHWVVLSSPNTPPLTNTNTNNPTFLKPKVNIFGLHPTYLLTNKPTYLAEFTSSLGHSPGLFSRLLIHPFQFLCLSVIISMLLCSSSFVKLVSLYRSAPRPKP